MASLWTPGGEKPVGDDPAAGAGGNAGESAGAPGGDGPSSEEMAAAREQLRRVREEVTQTPVADIVANHAIGLWQLAIIHLGLDGSAEEPTEPDLPQAKLAVDALASLLDGVRDRLGDHAEPLAAALSNLQLAYVQVAKGPGPEGGEPQGGDDKEE